MIRSGRRRHVVMWVVITSLTAYGLTSALDARRPGVAQGELLGDDTAREAWGTSVTQTLVNDVASDDVWDADWRRLDTGAVGVELTRRGSPRPNVLVYWRALELPDGDALRDATLLGATDGARRSTFEFPAGATSGALVLYNFADQTVVADVALPAELSR